MLKKIIEDVHKALDADACIAALTLALTIPDICGKAEYPELKEQSKKRYINWYDEYIGKYEKFPQNEDVPYLSGEVVYNLRCSMLHQGNPNINSDKIKDEICKVDEFILKIEKKNEFQVYSDSSCVIGDTKMKSYTVSVRRLCLILCWTASGYYENNQSKFAFNYKIWNVN